MRNKPFCYLANLGPGYPALRCASVLFRVTNTSASTA